MSETTTQLQTLMVYSGEAVHVTSGANFGDALSFADELMLDDVYQITPNAVVSKMALEMQSGEAGFKVGASSNLGTKGATIVLDSVLTFMAPDGFTFDALVFVELDEQDAIATYLLPLAEMKPKSDYRLVGLDTKDPMKRLAQAACVSFTRGTQITTATGKLKPIEDLKPGDKILTRNHGPQEIRWIGQETQRAVGDFAPILIKAGTLNNLNDLLLSPEHRLFVYQRSDKLGAGRKQVLIKVRHLVNDDTVKRVEGGFVEYFQLLLDNHYIIYAEGIAAESMLIDDRTHAALPDDTRDTVEAHGETRHQDLEVTDVPKGEDIARKLKEASAG